MMLVISYGSADYELAETFALSRRWNHTMRYSREHKAGTRSRIVRNASHVLRDKGLNGTGIVGLMKSAGLTRGGFYSHFRSREALVAEAVAYALAQTASEWRRYAGPSGGLDLLVASYLRQEHRDNPARGCPLPAVSADVARSGKKVRRTFTQSLDELLDALVTHIPDEPNEEARLLAAGVMATMVGSLILARACDDSELSSSMLDGGKRVVRSVAGGRPDLDKANRPTPRHERCGL
jgi:TetR/AcrR family transcriptional regulator, transcriptional repressor for nem operon